MIMRTGLGRIVSVAVSALLLVACTACGDSGAEVPDVVNKDYSAAIADLSKAGFYSYAGKDLEGKVAASGTVTKQNPAAGKSVDKSTKIELTVMTDLEKLQADAQKKKEEKQETQEKAQPAPAEKSTKSGLTQTYAQGACNQYGDKQFPYGFKPHTITGAAEPVWSDDSVLLQFKATTKNEYKAKSDVIINCNVRGTNDAPEVFGWNVQQ